MEVKMLDEKAFETIQRLSADKMSQAEIAAYLTNKGYTTAKGGPIKQHRVSVFLRRHGVTKHAHKVLRRKKKKSSFIIDIKEIANAELSEQLKERLIKNLVDQQSFQA